MKCPQCGKKARGYAGNWYQCTNPSCNMTVFKGQTRLQHLNEINSQKVQNKLH
jgi:hypothetical protein